MASFTTATTQARQFWDTRNMRQRTLLLAGTGATALLLFVFVRFLGPPDYKPMSTDLSPDEVQSLNAELDADGIPHQTSADGKTVSVPADKLDVARMKTAAQGAQHSGRMGFELFDKMSWGQTDFDQKVTYQRALEGELEKSIETLSDVESARVHLVMASDSVFLDRQQPAKASVILKLRGGGLSKQSALAIARLVAGAVDGLDPQDVSIIDADTARSIGPKSAGDDGDGDGLEATLTQRLVATLEPVVGEGKIRASVTVDHTQGSTEESDEKYDPAVQALLSDQKSEETETGQGAVAGGVPGTSSNTPVAKTAKPANAPNSPTPSQTSTTESAQYGVNKTVIHSVMPAGQIQRISAAVLVDDTVTKTVQGGKTIYTRRRWTPDELSKIQGIAQAVIGFDAKRGDTVTVQNMPFDSENVESDLAKPTLIEKGREIATDYSPILRPVALLALFVLAYMFVVRPVQKQVLSSSNVQMAPQPALPIAPPVERLSRSSITSDEQSTQTATKLKNQMVELINQRPANSARALQTWLREEHS